MVSVHWTSLTGETHLAGRLDEVGPARLQRFTGCPEGNARRRDPR